MRDKTCPDCGDELATLPWGQGTVWQCVDHGVKEWFFDPDAEPAPARAFGDLAAAVRAVARAEAHAAAPRRPEADFRRR